MNTETEELEIKSPKVKEALEIISGLSLLEASELKKAIENKFGVSAAAPVAIAAAGGGAGSSNDNAEAEKTSFDVVISSVGSAKLQVVKAVKEVTGLALKEAKELVDQAPKEVLKGANKSKAEEAKGILEKAGASVELK